MDPRTALTQASVDLISKFLRENRGVVLDSLESAKTDPKFAAIELFPLKVKLEFVLWVAYGASGAINFIRREYGLSIHDITYLDTHVKHMLGDTKYERRWILPIRSGVPKK
mgnify:CR=1 FL=1